MDDPQLDYHVFSVKYPTLNFCVLEQELCSSSRLLELLAAFILPHFFPTLPLGHGPFPHRGLSSQSSSLCVLVTCISSTCHMVDSRDFLMEGFVSGRKQVCGGLHGLPQTPSRKQSLTVQETLKPAALGHLPAFRQEEEGSERNSERNLYE